jgi:hypothetical protein
MKYIVLNLIIMVLLNVTGFAQTRTVGLFVNDTSKTYKGYTLFAPKQNTMTYLVNNEGRIVHQWTASKYPPGQSVYLLENGHLLRTCMTKGKLSSGGGEGGRIEEYDWDDNLVWTLDFSTETYMQHHDIRLLPNGNIIMLVIEKKTYEECIAAGFDPSKFQPEIKTKGIMVPDYIVEIQPTKPVGGKVVWEWHTWDHLVQDFDAAKSNYGVPKNHPELVDCDGDGRNIPAFWNHMNSIDYNPIFDQIAVSVRGNSEVWIIDHSTTTEEAKGHTGGKRGKGGDLLFRWGNPMTYGAGTKTEQRYFEQHDVEWVLPGRPGAGNMTCFNNGLGRGGQITYSTVDEFTPSCDANGNYTITSGSAFTPKDFTWRYKGTTENPLYSENISGAFRLPNGNTILCSGTIGLFLEVTSTSEIVWKYICPVELKGRITQGNLPADDPARAEETMNSVFRIYKYALDYPAFTGRDMTPGEFVELYTVPFFDLKVISGSGTGYYQVGNKITVTANKAADRYVFDKWTGDVSALSDLNSSTAVLTMPNKAVTITANYKSTNTEKYTLTVNSGSGSGSYYKDDTVTVKANKAATGYEFDKWTGDTDYLLKPLNETTKAVIPAKNISITATYKETTIEKFTLTVNSGSGSGSYKVGDTVQLIADAPPQGYIFDRWTGDIIYLTDQFNDTTNLIMPAKAVEVKAENKLITGIEDNNQPGFSISPNPASDYLYFKGLPEGKTIEIYNILGEKVKSTNNTMYIDINELQPGMYLIIIDQVRFKFLKI